MSDVDPLAEQSASRRFSAVYFTRLRLAGIRCFGPEQALNLANGDRPAKWTVILGENGVGKTTILQSAWITAPNVQPPAPGTSPGSSVRRRPPSERGLGWRRSADSPLSILADLQLGEALTSGNVGAPAGGGIRSQSSHGETVSPYPAWANALCCGYGALRRWSTSSIETRASEAVASHDTAASLFSDDAGLLNGPDWLLLADYAAKATKEPRAVARFDKVRSALIDLLPDVTDLRIAGLDEDTPQPRVEAHTPYGWIPMRALGLGYRSMIAWVIDLASRMFEAYPESEHPLAEPAIALVDEIDLHLHPRWQREITSHLDRLFPNVQFIVTAHSPLVVQSHGVTNIVVLQRADDHVEVVNEPDAIRGWRVDQILTSDLFGLPSARAADIERLFDRQQELVLLDDPTDAQRAELATIDAKLDELVPGETTQDRETWAVARRLANRLASDAG